MLNTTSGTIKNRNAGVWWQPSNFKTGKSLNNGKHDMALSCCIILDKNKNN
jgi:hypothetical protein